MVLPLSRQKHKRSRSEGGIDDVAAKKRFRKNHEVKGRKSTSALGFSPSPKKTIGSGGKINISLDGEESVDLTKKDWERYMQLKAVGWTHVISPQASPEPDSARPRTSSLTKLSKKERHMIKKLQSGKRDTSPFRKSARKIGKRKLARTIAMGVPENSLFVPTHNPSEGDDPNFISIKPSPAHRLPRVKNGLHKLKVANANKVETINIAMEVPVESLQKKRLKKLQTQNQNDEDDDPVVISISPPAHKLSKKARRALQKFKVTNLNEEMLNSEMEVSTNSLIVPPVIQEPESSGEHNSILASDTQKLSNKQMKRLKKLQAKNQIEVDDPVVISIIPPTHKLPKKGLHKLKVTIANEKDPSNSNSNAPTMQLLSKKKKKKLHKLEITNADEEESSNINSNVQTMQKLFKKAKKGLHKFKVTNTNEEEPLNNNGNIPPMQQLSTKAKEAVMKQQKRLEAEGKKANQDCATNGGEDVVTAEESDGEKAAKTTPKRKRLLTQGTSVEDVGGKKRRLSGEVGTKNEENAVLETKVKQQPKKKRFVLFVGQLPLTSTDVDVRSHFSSAGTATSIRLMRDKQTNQSRGMAFVEFDNKEAYEKGLSLNHTFLGGRRINVEYTHNGRSHEGRAKMRHKNLKLQAMRHTGKLRGSKPASGKRSARRAKMRNANKPR